MGDVKDTTRDIDNPDFYLASAEGYGLEEPRSCRVVKRMRGDTRDDYLLIRINPPLIGQPYGLGARDLGEVVIATRHEGASLFPIREWPVFVHVARLTVPAGDETRIRDQDLIAIGWGEIYPTRDSAERKVL